MNMKLRLVLIALVLLPTLQTADAQEWSARWVETAQCQSQRGETGIAGTGFVDALRARLPNLEIGDAEAGPRTFELLWSPNAAGACVVTVAGPDLYVALELGAHAGWEAREAAAARIAWILEAAALQETIHDPEMIAYGASIYGEVVALNIVRSSTFAIAHELSIQGEVVLPARRFASGVRAAATNIARELAAERTRNAPPVEEAAAAVEYIGFGGDIVPGIGTSSSRAELGRRVSLGLLGTLSGGINGAEFTPGVAINHGDLRGFQFGGVTAQTRGASAGMQLSALNTTALGSIFGLQLSALSNYSRGVHTGAQIAAANVNRSLLSGMQLGLVNIGHDVRGAQIGLINVSSTSTASIGVINIVRRGRREVEISADEAGMMMLAYKSGSDIYRSILRGGVHLWRGASSPRAIALGGGFAFHIGMRIPAHVEVALTLDALLYDRPRPEVGLLTTFGVSMAWEVTEHVAVFAGPSLRALTLSEQSVVPIGPRHGQAVDTTGEVVSIGSTNLYTDGWLGFSAGFRFY